MASGTLRLATLRLLGPSVTPHTRQVLVAVAVATPSAVAHASLLAVVVAPQMVALVAVLVVVVAAARQLAVARQMLREVAVHMAAARQMLLAMARQVAGEDVVMHDWMFAPWTLFLLQLVAGQVAAMVLARQEQGQWEVAVMHAWIFAPGALMQPNCHLMQLQLGHLLQHCLLVDL